jgi:flagellar biosynthetic protein FliO
MGRLHRGLLRRATAVLCMAGWLMAGCPVHAQSDNSTAKGSPAPAGESVMADIPAEFRLDAENPMEAVRVVGYFGFGAGQLAPSSLLSIGSDAIVSGTGSYMPQTQEEFIRMQLLQSRQRIQALSLASAADDQFGLGNRFAAFPAEYLMEAPSLREAETQPPAASGKSSAQPNKEPPKTAQPKKPRPAKAAVVPAASPADQQDITTVLAELSEAEQDLKDQRILAELLAEDDATLADTEVGPVLPVESVEIAQDYPDTAAAQGGFHGLMDLSRSGEQPAAAIETAETRTPGSFMGRFGIRMAIFTVALLFIASFLKTRGNPLARLSKRSLKVLETVSLGPGRQIVIVEMQGSSLVLGVTNGSINLLDRLPGAALSEQYRDTVQGIIQRESTTDNASWKQRPALNLLDSKIAQPMLATERDGFSHRISVSDLRRARGKPQAATVSAQGVDNDNRSQLISRVRNQLERIRG